MTTFFDDWQAPIPLGALEVPLFPKGVFPDKIERFVEELSRSTETPRDLPAMVMLAVLATVSHDKYVVQIKPDYQEPVCLWTAVVLAPGNRKSSVLSAVIKPIEKYEREKRAELEAVVKMIQSKNKSLEARIRELRNQLSKASMQDFEHLQKELFSLEQEIEQPPNFPQLWTSDITPENLGVLMVANKGCAAILSDEAGIIDNFAGRYFSGIANLDLVLKGHVGGSARVNRMGRDADLIDRAILSMGLTPQPDVLRALGKNGIFRGRGFLGRLLYAVPHSNLGQRNLDAASMPTEVEKAYHKQLEAILLHQLQEEQLYRLHLSKDAFEKWFWYSKVLEISMDEGGPFSSLTDWASKLAGHVARIAALLHIAKHAHGQPWTIEISVEEMSAAISIGRYLEKHALAAFDFMGADPAVEGARSILKWIEKHRWPQFTFRDCHYAHKSRFKKAIDMDPCIKVLEETYYIREYEEEKKKAYRPSRLFLVNPQIFKEEI